MVLDRSSNWNRENISKVNFKFIAFFAIIFCFILYRLKMADETMESKYKNSHQKVSADEMRSKLRKKFLASLQEARRKNIDSKRFLNSSKSQIVDKSTQDMRGIFMDNEEHSYNIPSDQMDLLFRKLDQVCNMNRNLQEVDIEAIIKNFLPYYCSVCDNLNENNVCPSCGSHHSSYGS
ncbi:hypothetical protein WA026_008676 [Henosepilachna vigintioctopunctata]|uniref:Uncharacterized protein n=1 Tax=Henosepilachna vigintioctopunctata TaxID=420089 RepID=A0AAW1VD45_9CUCU